MAPPAGRGLFDGGMTVSGRSEFAGKGRDDLAGCRWADAANLAQGFLVGVRDGAEGSEVLEERDGPGRAHAWYPLEDEGRIEGGILRRRATEAEVVADAEEAVANELRDGVRGVAERQRRQDRDALDRDEEGEGAGDLLECPGGQLAVTFALTPCVLPSKFARATLPSSLAPTASDALARGTDGD
jgi:hypothetical protein